jgi:hypothetical protein
MNTNQQPNLRSAIDPSASLVLWIISGLYLLTMVSLLLLLPVVGYGVQEAQQWLVPAVVVSNVSYGILMLWLWPYETASSEGRAPPSAFLGRQLG